MKEKKQPSIVFGLRISSEVYQKILDIARENNQSASAVARLMIHNALERLLRGEIIGLK